MAVANASEFASSHADLVPALSSNFGSGMRRNSSGCVISVDSGKVAMVDEISGE